jgi:aspartyl-tRNA(Asn)/glutamyl-tRNA(Gln) amidotransferase subunit A
MTGTYVLSAGYYDAYYKKAQKIRRLLVNEFAEVFKKVDVLLTPTQPNVAPKSGLAQNDPIFAYIADRLVVNCNLAGLPAISVPCGFARPTDDDTPSMNPHPSRQTGHPLPSASAKATADKKGEGNNVGVPPSLGLPVGLQIIGPQWGEQKIFNVGYAYQQVTDWHRKHPTM